jgi:hypothetical protein
MVFIGLTLGCSFERRSRRDAETNLATWISDSMASWTIFLAALCSGGSAAK